MCNDHISRIHPRPRHARILVRMVIQAVYDVDNSAFSLTREEARPERTALQTRSPRLHEDALSARIEHVVRAVIGPLVDAPANGGMARVRARLRKRARQHAGRRRRAGGDRRRQQGLREGRRATGRDAVPRGKQPAERRLHGGASAARRGLGSAEAKARCGAHGGRGRGWVVEVMADGRRASSVERRASSVGARLGCVGCGSTARACLFGKLRRERADRGGGMPRRRQWKLAICRIPPCFRARSCTI
ncbi:hypothetical protein FGB62_100g310 [Gracilaria domingensis]|nr:hypothetical protein FGB62_100g310 [Gracilaria domingensis]